MTGEERAAILALLESEYESERHAADAIWAGVTDLLMSRPALGISLPPIAWGPIYDLRSAKRTAQMIGGRVAKLYPAKPLLDRALETMGKPPLCGDCGHPVISHVTDALSWGVDLADTSPGCCVSGCTCR